MFSDLTLPMIALLVVLGVTLDIMFGEVRRYHPLVGFGRIADALEKKLNRGKHQFIRGAVAWLLAMLPPVMLVWTLLDWVGAMANVILHTVLLYFCLGLRSLHDHTLPVQNALLQGDLVTARTLAARIVSRDMAQADETDIAKACVESLLENGNDAVFGTLFWFVVAGAPGALLFRLANTLDAMWGYRTPRFNAFGRAAARIDDALNWIPARLTALSYALLGNTRIALRCWKTQAPAWPSPNAGPVMAAGAGALGLALGGTATYAGVIETRPPLGLGRAPGAADIARAWQMVGCTTLLWTILLGMAALAAINWS